MIPSGQNELSSSLHFNITAEVRQTDLESQQEHGKFWRLLFGITRDPSGAVNVSLPGLCDYDVSRGPQIAKSSSSNLTPMTRVPSVELKYYFH